MTRPPRPLPSFMRLGKSSAFSRRSTCIRQYPTEPMHLVPADEVIGVEGRGGVGDWHAGLRLLACCGHGGPG